jgi:hypothetical protein
MKKLLLLPILALLSIAAHAQTPDWSTKVAPILFNHCASCHHDGGIAPFSLTTYLDAVHYAASIKADVNSKKMPPWPPDPTFSHMAHERILSAADISTINRWVDGGTPQGTPSLAPPVPVYSTTGVIPGTPDLVVRIPTYTSTATTGDVYQCFAIPSGLLTDKFIRAFEAVPGNPAMVHHVLVYSDTTGICPHLDSLSPGPGYPNFGGTGSNNSEMVGIWVPGSDPMTYPNGYGLKLRANCDLVVQMHYPAGTAGLKDSTEIRFFFAPSTGLRQVFIQPLLYHETPIINTPLTIPANTVKTFTEQFPPAGIPFSIGDQSLLGIFPHMHLIGRSIKSYGILPSGDTDKYIRINKWDFHWQGFYMLPRLKKIPDLTSLRAEAVYDNTTANPENPSNPPQDVVAGEATTNEMMIVFFLYTAYAPGDENVIVDSAVALSTASQYANYYRGQQLLDVCPNPAVSDIIIKCYLEEQDQGNIDLIDMQGKVVKQLMTNATIGSGYSAFTFPVSGLAPGTYSVVLKTSQRVLSQKVVVVH